MEKILKRKSASIKNWKTKKRRFLKRVVANGNLKEIFFLATEIQLDLNLILKSAKKLGKKLLKNMREKY